MIKLLRKHQKKALAFCGVVLMVTFAMTSNTNRTPTGPKPLQIGKWNGGPIYNTDLAQARQEWIALKRYVAFTMRNRYTGQEEQHSIVESVFPAAAITEIEQKPELFMLLRLEALDANVQINKDELEDIMTNHYAGPTGPDDDTREFTEDAVADLLRIVGNFNRLAGDVKISQPQRDLELAKVGQNIQLSVVELSASRFASKVAAPPTQAITAQFAKYGNVDPGKPDAGNPFGFGYRLADRVKLQYVQIDRGAAEKVVRPPSRRQTRRSSRMNRFVMRHCAACASRWSTNSFWMCRTRFWARCRTTGGPGAIRRRPVRRVRRIRRMRICTNCARMLKRSSS
jgi:hypothetical protein